MVVMETMEYTCAQSFTSMCTRVGKFEKGRRSELPEAVCCWWLPWKLLKRESILPYFHEHSHLKVQQDHVRLMVFAESVNKSAGKNVWRSMGPEWSCSGGCVRESRQDSQWLGTQKMNYRIGF